MMWAHILDWIPISMTNQDEAQSILESFLLPSFHGLVYTIFGSISQIIWSGFPYIDISKAITHICPPMHVDMTTIFVYAKLEASRFGCLKWFQWSILIIDLLSWFMISNKINESIFSFGVSWNVFLQRSGCHSQKLNSMYSVCRTYCTDWFF